ncbi:MAG: trigger factor, partial [Gammaproteobacteria bacterium]
MQVSVETIQGLERKIIVSVPAEPMEKEIESRLARVAKTARIKGFRPGKVPLKVVRQHYGMGLQQEVLGEVMSRSFYEAVQQEKLRPAGRPAIELKEVRPGQNIRFEATFEVYPEVKLADLSAITVQKPVSEVTEADMAEMIDQLRKQQSTWETVDRAAQEGDRVLLTFEGTIDGEPFEGGKGEKMPVVIGSGRMIEGFEDGLVGLKAGEEKTLDLTFPEDYPKEELKGKPVQFKVKAEEVSAQEPAVLDDAFFRLFGVEEGGEAKFREEVKANMERELKQGILNRLKTQVMDGLLDLHDVAVPKSLLKQEIDALREQAFQQFGGGSNLSPSMLPDELFAERAERRVALGIIVATLVDELGIKPDAAQVRSKVEELASTYQQPEQVIQWYYSNQDQLAVIESMVLEDAVVNAVLEKAGSSDRKASYREVLQGDWGKEKSE